MRKSFSVRAPLVWVTLWCCLTVLPVTAQTNLPSLRLAVSNNAATVFWPNAAYYFLLQSTRNLSSSTDWVNEASAALPVVSNNFPSSSGGGYPVLATNFTNNEISFSASATGPQKFYRLKSPWIIPLTSFAIFYNGPLEFSTAPYMVLNGLVHANGPIYLGSGSLVTFNQPVTTTDAISSPAADGFGPWTTNNWNVNFYGSPPFITNLTQPDLAQIVQIGTNNPHGMIEIPPAGENPGSPPILRFYDEAQMVLLVTNSLSGGTNPSVELILQNNGFVADPSPIVLFYTNASPGLVKTNLPFLSLTNVFYDGREMKTNLVTQIDVGLFASWILTNYVVQAKFPTGLNMLYVADQRIFSPAKMSVVRLVNGAQLPANNNLGFTVATLNPLYVLGNYNVQIASSTNNASAGTTNTAYTVPAALVSDALTVLSGSWSDATSLTKSYSLYLSSYQVVADDTINAAIMTGTVPSTGTGDTNFSGGIHNLPRLLEYWVSRNLWLNTSIIRLWDSQMATNTFRNPLNFSPPPVNPYYNPPTRKFSFDPNLLNANKIPPGVPVLYFGGN